MASGHTDRDTINERKPLTDRMAYLLLRIARPTDDVQERDLTIGSKNALRGLRDRGFIRDNHGRNDEPICLSPEGEAWLKTEEALKYSRGAY